MKKAKRGRPPIAASDRLQVFSLRVTRAEREAIERAAEKAGQSVTTWAREILVAQSRSRHLA